MFCQEEEEKRRKRTKIWTRMLLDRNKNGAHVVTVNVLRESDPYSFRRYLRMSSDVYELRMITRSEHN